MVSAGLLDLPYAIYLAKNREHIWSQGFYEILCLKKSLKPGFSLFYAQIHPEDIDWVKTSIEDFMSDDNESNSKQLSFRVNCNIMGFKWVICYIEQQISSVHGTSYIIKIYDGSQLKKSLSVLHEVHKHLCSVLPNNSALDIQYDPLLVDKVTEKVQIGWFEYYPKEIKTVCSSSLKPMMGLRQEDKFTLQFFKSLVDDEYTAKVMELASLSTVDQPHVILDLKAKVHEEDKWFNLNMELYYHDGNVSKVFGIVQDITELRETQDKLERAQEISNTGWFEYDVVNPESSKYSSKWLIMHGFDPDERPTWNEYLNQILPADRKKVDADIKVFLHKTHNQWDKLEYRLVDHNEKMRYISNSSRVLFENDQPIKVFGVCRDVTDTKEAQTALYKSERLHRLLSESSRDVIMLVTGDDIESSELSYISDSIRNLLGHEPDDLVGTKLRHLIHPDDLSIGQRELQRNLLVPGTSSDFSIRMKHIKGHFIWMEIIGNSFSFKNDNMIRFSARDITERRKFEEQLIQSNSDLDALIRATDNLIFVIDSDIRFERVIGTEDRFHIPSEEFIGECVQDIWTDANGVEMTQMVLRALSTHVGESQDCMHVNKRGEIEWLLVSTHPYLGYDEKYRVSVVVEEITQQKKYEQELQKTLDMERELSKMRSNFVAMASHQFRTPLTVIKSNMQLLDALDIQHPMLDKINGRLVREVDRLVDLMEDILLIGKAQTSNLKVKSEEISLDTLIDDIVKDVDQITDDQRMLQVFKIGDPVKFLGDYDLLRHALINVVTNAFKYSPGKPNPELKLDYTGIEFTTILIRDFGIGIATQEHERIFNDFYRGNNVRDIPGTGLGMSITREFLNLNGCSIEVKSELGLGSTFAIKLPK